MTLVAGYHEADIERRTAESAKQAALAQAAAVAERSPFARDRARVLHSASFRRLAGKTQVVGPDEADIPRTRLTHSLEVAQIAREMGEQLGCDPDLVDLAGLAHDIGHPPFGHNGERALNVIAAAIGGYEANAQNLRLLSRLEPKTVDAAGNPMGLNLTRASLDAVIKYPWTLRPEQLAQDHPKYGSYQDDSQILAWVREGAPEFRQCLEAQVMDWSDDVAYSVHDVEDGIHAGRINLSDLLDPEEQLRVCQDAAAGYSTESAGDLVVVLADLLSIPVVAAVVRGNHLANPEAALKQMMSELTGRFATGAAAATREAFGPGQLNRYRADLIVPRLLRAEVAVLKAIALRYVMNDPKRRSLQSRQRELLTDLVSGLVQIAPAGLDPSFAVMFNRALNDGDRLRVIIDQVSLLTDTQAVARYTSVTGRTQW